MMSPFTEEIKKQDVVDKLTLDDSVNDIEIYVNVRDATVELRGTVQNFTAKMAAERDTCQVQNLEYMLAWNSEINAENIEVSTKDHEVTISGQVGSYWEKYQAGNYANSTRGVIEEDRISVEVHNGIVHLSGSVPGFLTKIQTNNIAMYTSGVKDVVDETAIS